MRDAFRLFLLGYLRPGQELIVLAQFKGYSATNRRPLTEPVIKGLLDDIKRLRVFIEAGSPAFDAHDLTALGGRLFDLVIDGTVKRVLDRAAVSSREGGDLMPLELVVEDHTLAAWPWEYLFDQPANSFLCQEFHPIVRGVFSLVQPRDLKPLREVIRVLIILGVGNDDPQADPEEQLKWIENVFTAELASDAVEVRVLQGSSFHQLQSVFDNEQFHVIHFFGHARFDAASQEGYLRFDVKGGQQFRLEARQFAQLISQKQREVRLVFLNACETGRASVEDAPARSSIAAALLDLGVPAVVATQFSMPDTSAHYLAATIYNGLASGKSLVDALTTGRQAMRVVQDAKFFDWGIPVLYAADPSLKLFPAARRTPGTEAFALSLGGDATGLARAMATEQEHTAPSFKVTPSRPKARAGASAKVKTALVDLDVKAGFLPELIEQANAEQSYFSFELAYLPFPTGSVLTDIGGETVEPQLFIPRIEQYFKDTPTLLQVDRVICITACLVAFTDESGNINYNYFSSPLHSNKNVSVVSTTHVREYAREAKLDFPKALLRLVLGQLVVVDPRWSLGYHEKTHGCLFDFCRDRHDLVKGLHAQSLTHTACRAKIKDKELLQSIDTLMGL